MHASFAVSQSRQCVPVLVLLTLAVLYPCFSGGAPAMAQTVVVHPAENLDPEQNPPGVMPYEMAGRPEGTPLVSFDNVTGWEVVGSNAEGRLYQSADQHLWQPHSGKLLYVGKGSNPELFVRAQKPVQIPDPWDSLNCWTYGNNWGWAPDPKTPVLLAAAVVRDSAGWEFEIPLGRMDYQYWFLMNGRLHAEELARIKRPAYFVGLRFRNAGNQDPRKVYLGPCYFFKENLQPLSFAPAPEKLPFPTRPETILPTNKVTGFRNSVRQEGKDTIFAYGGPDCNLEYRYTPTDGTLGDLRLLYKGQTVRPCAGGGVQLVGPAGILKADDPAIKRTLRTLTLEKDTLRAVWRLEADNLATDVEYRFRMAQKSLIVETTVAEPIAEALTLGRVEGVTDQKLVQVPYLTYGGGTNDPRVLYAQGLFYFTQFDWYVSDASVLYGGASLGPDWAVCNGGARYNPKTDGTRNRVRERLFLTASPDFVEVLPNIPNPPSPWKEVQGERLWRTKHGSDMVAELAEATHLRKLGCEKMTVRYHEDSWRDGGESYTFRLQAAPGRGGDAALRSFVQSVQALGWRVGLYTNYTDYAPVNAYWNEDWVTRTSNGDWLRAWMRCYAPKPLRAVEMEALLAPQIQAKFGENHSYCDVHTAVTPFSRVDYDARVPGAGTFRQVFECFGRLLYNEKFAHKGPAYSEGNNHWWYAGLVDGNYAQTQVASNAPERLLVDFDLLKMHPLSMDAGLNYRGGPRVSSDQHLACILAYGHIGGSGGPGGSSGAARDYYMLQQTQKRYAMEPVAKIEYDNQGTLVEISQAIITDAYKSGRVHVVYQNGTEVYVNGSAGQWSLKTAAGQLELPEWGYVVFRPGENPATRGLDLLTASTLVPVAGPDATNGPRQRVDQSLGTNQFYANSRGGFVNLGALALQGVAAVKLDTGAWWLIPQDKCADVAFSPVLLGAEKSAGVRVEALKEDDSAGPAPTLRWSRGLLHVIPGAEQAFRYRLTATAESQPAQASCDTTLAPIGAQVRVVAPAGVRRDQAFWEVDGRRQPATVQSRDGALICDVPANLQPGSHLWLGLPMDRETLWLDFIAAAPLTVTLDSPLPATLQPGQRLKGTAQISSLLDSETQVNLSASVAGGTCEPPTGMVRVPARGTISWRFEAALPATAGRCDLLCQASSGTYKGTGLLAVSTESVYPVVADLLDPNRPFTRGRCVRGGQEVEGFRIVEDGSFEPMAGTCGGVTRNGFFSHPPYASGKVGYSFALWDIALPAGQTSAFITQIGMRDGLHTTDGVTFKVVVIDAAGKPTEVFSRHHAELRWEPVTVDLKAFAGQKIRLKLVADCGPANNTTADHAFWAEPKVIVKDEAARQTIVTAAAK